MKNKFFLCIRPIVAETEDGEPQYLAVSKEGSCNRKISTTPEDSCSSVSGREKYYRRQEPSGGSHRTFSQAIKAVLFEVTVRKSVRERNIRRLSPQSNSNDSQNGSTRLNRSDDESVNRKPDQTEPDFQQQAISPTTSISSSNSLSPKKQSISGEVNDTSHLNHGMYLIFIALFATILWGKIYGILCTSMWLYIAPRLGGESDRRSMKPAKLPETEEESVEYKKKVIMEGLLERNHRRDRDRAL